MAPGGRIGGDTSEYHQTHSMRVVARQWQSVFFVADLAADVEVTRLA